MDQPQNFFSQSPAEGNGREIIDTLLEQGAVRVERIASHGQASPEGFWYDQPADEWVMLVQGSATLEFEDDAVVDLARGDWRVIPKRVRHRVARTSHDALWLAVHVG